MSERPGGLPSAMYLAIFGRCEIEHFRDELAMHSFMRDELEEHGVDPERLQAIDGLRDAYVTLIHDRAEGPVQWGKVEFHPTDEANRADAMRGTGP